MIYLAFAFILTLLVLLSRMADEGVDEFGPWK
jgi:hypothetical protein